MHTIIGWDAQLESFVIPLAANLLIQQGAAFLILINMGVPVKDLLLAVNVPVPYLFGSLRSNVFDVGLVSAFFV